MTVSLVSSPAPESNASAGFDQFRLHATVERGIEAAGFETPRPIQTQTIPAGLDGRDVLGLAQTGTGKTAAFALPLLHRFVQTNRKGPRALVLAPTRELAIQIAAEIRLLSRFTRVKTVTVFGGIPQSRQVSSLRQRPEIVVGCPGRVLDLLEQGVLRLDAIETLVLDEADHMFDMGFLPDIRRILDALPQSRQNLLFSATMPREIRGLADDLLRDPHTVELVDTAPARTIDHALVLVDEARKRELLGHLLGSAECRSAIVFGRTKHRVRRLTEQLCRAGHRAVGLQGNLSQAQRDRAMRGFRERRYDVLVATDIASRGIDVSDVSHVINFDVPGTPEAYTHRLGRTGRAERTGVACTFVTSQDGAWVRATERMIGAPIAWRQIEGFDSRGLQMPLAGTARQGEGRSPSGSRPGGRPRRRSQVGGRTRVQSQARPRTGIQRRDGSDGGSDGRPRNGSARRASGERSRSPREAAGAPRRRRRYDG